MDEIKYDADGIATTVADQRGLGIREIIEGGFGPARTPGPGETVVAVQPDPHRRATGPAKEEEKT